RCSWPEMSAGDSSLHLFPTRLGRRSWSQLPLDACFQLALRAEEQRSLEILASLRFGAVLEQVEAARGAGVDVEGPRLHGVVEGAACGVVLELTHGARELVGLRDVGRSAALHEVEHAHRAGTRELRVAALALEQRLRRERVEVHRVEAADLVEAAPR